MNLGRVGKQNGSGDNLHYKPNVKVIPRARIFSTSIGFFAPLLIDAVAHTVSLEDLHSIQYFFESDDLGFTPLNEDELIQYGLKFPLLSHDYQDEGLVIHIKDLLHGDDFVKQFIFDNQQEVPSNDLLNSTILSSLNGQQNPNTQELTDPNPRTIGSSPSQDALLYSNNPNSVLNAPPVALEDYSSTIGENPVTMNLLLNDSDPDNDLFSIIPDSLSKPSHGQVNLNSNGTVTYTPNPDFYGTDSFNYQISDGKGGIASAKAFVTIIPMKALDDTASLKEDSSISIDVLDNDIDLGDGKPISVVTSTNGSNGVVSINTDGTVQYTPNKDFHGTDKFTYTITDGKGRFDTATVTVNVSPLDDAVDAINDSGTTNEEVAITTKVLNNDTDFGDGDILSVTSASKALNGSVFVNPNNTITYTPNKDFFGTDSYTYTITDGQGNFDTATVNITVNPVDDPVDAINDSSTTNEDTPVITKVLDNDNKFGDLDTLTVTSTSTPSHGSTAINPDGTITYTPNKDFFGTDSYTYTITDGHSNFDTATVNITINPVDDLVDASNDSSTTNEDTPVTIKVLLNDTDFGDGDTLSVVATTLPLNGSIVTNPDNTITYTPNSNFNGTDSFTYQITDGKGNFDTATVNLTILPINDPPVALNDSKTTNEDTSVDISVLANDSDIDLDKLTVTFSGNGSNGTTSINPDGTIKYTPNKDFNGTDSFIYTIEDGNGGSSTATVTVTINPINDAPIAKNDSYSTNEDTALNINALSGVIKSNDSDVDGNILTISSNTLPSNGSLSLNPDGSFLYTPNANFFGSDSFTYTITDGQGGFDTATVNITVNPIDDPVDAINDSTSTNEDTPVTISVLSNDNKFGDNDVLTVTATPGLPSNGSVTINGDNTIKYTPNANFFGTDSFTYTITDGKGNFDTATVNITVNPIDDPVDAINDSTTTNEDTPVTISVLSNDNKFGDSDVLTVTATPGLPSNGSVTINGDNTIKYTPNANFFGTDSFTYTITDGKGNFDTATVTVSITSVNDLPDAKDDAYSTNEDTKLTVVVGNGVLKNDTDVEGALTVTAFDPIGTNGGTVSVNANGSFSYTPAANFFGTDTFTYTVTDTNGATDTATVTITVNTVNDLPIAKNDAYSTNEDTPITVIAASGVLINDSDVEGPLTVSKFDATSGQGGTVSMNPDGSFSYSPKANFFGTDTFTYTVTDINSATATATVTITVNPIDDIVDAVNDTISTNEDTPITTTVLGNDNKFGDPESLTVTATPSLPSNGTVVINGDNTIKYTPNANFFGTDTYTYTITDGKGNFDTATVNITVNPVDDIVDAINDSASTNEEIPVTISVLSNDNKFNDPESLTVASIPTAPTKGATLINPDGTITYTPNKDFFGTDTFVYRITDGKGNFDNATVTVTVANVDDGVDAVNDTTSTNEDTAKTISVLTNDNKFGDPESLTITTIPSLPSNGTAVISGTNIKYTPNANYFGTDSFTYTITDGLGNFDTATVNITINSVNDLPVAKNDAYATSEDTPITVVAASGVLTNDSDVEGALTVSKFDATSGQGGTVSMNPDGSFSYTPKANFFGTDTFTYTVKDTNSATATATVTITVGAVDDPVDAINDTRTTNEDTPITISVLSNDNNFGDPEPLTLTTIPSAPSNGTALISGNNIKYTPNANFFGTDTFTYTITDGLGNFDTATVTVNVTSVNDLPIAVNDSGTTNEDTPIDINVLANDSDPVENSALSVKSFTNGSNGVVSKNGDGSLKYTPNANFYGTDSFTYVMQDADGGTATATVNITVIPQEDPVDAVNDTSLTQKNSPVTITVLGNDNKFNDPDTLTVTATPGLPSNGTVSINPDNTIKYTPNSNFFGTDSFTYTITDGNGNFDTATVTVTVNDPPDAINDTSTTNEDTPVNITVLTNDTDADGDKLTVTKSNNGSNGSTSINPDGSIKYTPNKDFFGTDSFTYTISDGKGGTDTATVNVTIASVNDAPDAINDTATTQEEVPIKITVLANDTDIENDTLTVTKSTNGSNGSTSINPDGTVTYTPNKDFFGTDSFTYTITDGNGGFDTATVTVTVTNVQDAPDAEDDGVTTFEDTQITFTVLSNDQEYDKEPLSVTTYSTTSNGSLTFNAGTQRFTYTPKLNYVGSDTFNYTVTDGQGNFDTATVTITVQPINDPPDAINNSFTIQEDTVTDFNVLSNDVEVDGDTMSVVSVTNPQNGTASINPDGSIKYTPKLNYFGTDTFTYRITDGNGLFDTATVNVTITPVNDNPVTVTDIRSTYEEVALKIPVLSNDSDVDKDTLTLSSYSSASNGTLSNSGNIITYTPNKDFVGTDSFTYVVSDGNGGNTTGTVSINVLQVNDAPIAKADTASLNEDTTLKITVLANDTDVDGDTLSVVSVNSSNNANVSINPDGTVQYTPKANYNGTDTFTYTISDSKGGLSTATVTVNVAPVQDVPDAINDGFDQSNATVSLDGSPITVNVLSNDVDVDGDKLTVVAIPSNPANGTVIINPDNTIKYTPNGSFVGTDSFTYQISDGNGNFDTATVQLSVKTGNNGQSSPSDFATTNEDSSVIINVLANDIDPEGDKLSVLSTTNPSNGTVTINPDGTLTYTPKANFNGTDSFSYRAWDGKGNFTSSNVTVTVLPVPDPPDAVNDSVSVLEDSPITISILANDSDPDGDKVSVTSLLSSPTKGSAILNPNGTVTYTPNANYNGADSFTYQITDGNGNFDTATVNINVIPVQDAPIVVDDIGSGNEDSVITFNIFTNDSEVDGDPVLLNSFDPVSNGTLSISDAGVVTYTPNKDFFGTETFNYSVVDIKGNIGLGTVTINVLPVNDAPVATNDFIGTNEDESVNITVLSNDTDIESDTLTVDSVTQGANGSVVINPDKTLTYTPIANFNGQDSFTYTISDGNGGFSTATVNVTVNAVNDNPIANNDTATTNEETLVTVTVLSNDSDIDGDSLVVTNLSQPNNGLVSLNADKTITYTPDKNFNGVDSFTYTINDGRGGSNIGTVTITVNNTDDPIVAYDDTASTNEDTTVVIDVLANDDKFGDPDTLTVLSTTTPTNGSVVINPNGSISYTPNSNYFGTDSFFYTVSDGQGNQDTAFVSITVVPVQDSPIANPDSKSTTTNTPTVVNVLSNDSDPDGDTITVTAVTQGSSGGIVSFTLSNVTYTSQSGFTGTETFTYTINDGNGNNAITTVTMTVT